MESEKISKILIKTLSPLSERYRKILEERFGLKGNSPLSLEAIGKKRGITRERVRQIINSALSRLKIPAEFKPYLNWAKMEIKAWGGIKGEDIFACESEIHFFFDESVERNFFPIYKFLLLLSGEIKYHPRDERFERFFYLEENDLKRLEKIINFFEKKLERKEILNANEFASLILVLSKKYHLPEAVVCSYLALVRGIETNILGEVGFAESRRVKPKGIGDQLHLVFQKVKKPMHFSEVMKVIESNNYWPKSVSIHTVHNQLIEDERFVLVGRGIYALKDWGYSGGPVREVLRKILSSAKKPLKFQEIVFKVKKELMVKEGTIKSSLNQNPEFQSLPDGRWVLKEKIKLRKL